MFSDVQKISSWGFFSTSLLHSLTNKKKNATPSKWEETYYLWTCALKVFWVSKQGQGPLDWTKQKKIRFFFQHFFLGAVYHAIWKWGFRNLDSFFSQFNHGTIWLLYIQTYCYWTGACYSSYISHDETWHRCLLQYEREGQTISRKRVYNNCPATIHLQYPLLIKFLTSQLT